MVIRRNTKTRKYRGSRTCGGGSTKKRKGAGHRGGKGNAGGGKKKKTKWTWMVKYYPGYFGSRGFKTPINQVFLPITVNIDQMSEVVERQKNIVIDKDEKGRKVYDISKYGFHKLLGRGKIDTPIVVKAPSFSRTAIRKLESVGGKAVLIDSGGTG